MALIFNWAYGNLIFKSGAWDEVFNMFNYYIYIVCNMYWYMYNIDITLYVHIQIRHIKYDFV